MGVGNRTYNPHVWPAPAPRMTQARLNADLATISVEFDQATNQASSQGEATAVMWTEHISHAYREKLTGNHKKHSYEEAQCICKQSISLTGTYFRL